MDIINKNTELVALSKSLIRAKKSMDLITRKLFFCALEKISWSSSGNNNVIEMDAKDVITKIGLKTDKNHMSTDLRKQCKKLMTSSHVAFTGADRESWDDGMLIPNCNYSKSKITLTFNQNFMPLLEDLMKDKNYITMWASDIYNFKTERSYILYEYLRINCDTRITNEVVLSTKEIKELFDISKDDYMHFDKRKNIKIFDRTNFERRVIDTVCSELDNSKMISLIRDDSTKKMYTKIKKGNIIQGYKFTFLINTAPAIGTAKEIIEIEKDHELLKIAKDIKNSKKSSIKNKAANDFNNFKQNQIDDWASFEEQILSN